MSIVKTGTPRESAPRAVCVDPLSGILQPGFDRSHIALDKFGTRSFVLFDPELIRHCFVANSANYHQAEARKRLAEPLLGESILTADGEQSRKVRQTIGRLFNRQALDRYSARMIETTLQNLDDLAPGVHAASDLAARLALANLSASLFSNALDARSPDILAALDGVYDAMWGLPLVGDEGGVTYYPRLRRKERNEAAAAFRAVLGDIISDRLGRPADAGRSDLLDQLIALRKAQPGGNPTLERMIDDVATFVVAGHETTASVVAWTLYLLSQDARALQRARDEAEVVMHGGIAPEHWPEHLTFTLACVEETQRLYPPAPIFTRQAQKDDIAGGIAIPAGSIVLLPVRLIHRMQRFWTQPDRFMPERFLPQNRGRIGQFAFLPFGLGPRMCIGSAFGNREAIILVAAILSRFDLSYAGATPPVPELKFVMRSDNGIPMRLSAR